MSPHISRQCSLTKCSPDTFSWDSHNTKVNEIFLYWQDFTDEDLEAQGVWFSRRVSIGVQSIWSLRLTRWFHEPPIALHQGRKKPDIFWTRSFVLFRAGILKLKHLSEAPGRLVKMPTAELQTQSFCCKRTEKRSKNSHFSQVPKWGWCC